MLQVNDKHYHIKLYFFYLAVYSAVSLKYKVYLYEA